MSDILFLLFARLHIDNTNPIRKESFSLTKTFQGKTYNLYSCNTYQDVLSAELSFAYVLNNGSDSLNVKSVKQLVHLKDIDGKVQEESILWNISDNYCYSKRSTLGTKISLELVIWWSFLW